MSTCSNGPLLQQRDMERNSPSSPSPLCSPHTKSSGYIKGGLGQSNGRLLMSGTSVADGSRGFLQWVQSISFATVSLDHSLQLVSLAETNLGGAQGSSIMGSISYLHYSPVRTVGSTFHPLVCVSCLLHLFSFLLASQQNPLL